MCTGWVAFSVSFVYRWLCSLLLVEKEKKAHSQHTSGTNGKFYVMLRRKSFISRFACAYAGANYLMFGLQHLFYIHALRFSLEIPLSTCSSAFVYTIFVILLLTIKEIRDLIFFSLKWRKYFSRTLYWLIMLRACWFTFCGILAYEKVYKFNYPTQTLVEKLRLLFPPPFLLNIKFRLYRIKRWRLIWNFYCDLCGFFWVYLLE